MDAPSPGAIGGTYAGSPIACAAALAMIEVIEEERLIESAINVATLFRARLDKLQLLYPSTIGHLRTSHGAMMAMELVKNSDAEQPDAELTKAVLGKASEKGLILLACGSRGNVIRFLPALNISDELVDEGMDILAECLQELF